MLDPSNYTVGWICAVDKEYVAARAFLDETHDGPDHVSTHDNNVYTLGKMGKHNVVIAVAPDGEYGTQSAATVASHMLHSFTNVRVGLMVGIAGGAPSSKHDIRLGDIVVSAPRNGKGGVFQYDFGKQKQDQDFQTTGFLNQPPTLLRAAVAALRAQYESDGHELKAAVREALDRKPRLRKNYSQPDPSSDALYLSNIVHPLDNDGACLEVCSHDAGKLHLRPARAEEEDDPAIHYGLIASANRVMQDAAARDEAASQGVLCFEMEAAGLMNHFPCLVIRGVCDYADSHKNNEWQGYAAMVAAAYAKDILRQVAPNKIEAETPLAQLLKEVRKDIQRVQDDMYEVIQRQRSQTERNMLQWLTPIDYYPQHNDFISQRQPDTGQWLLDTEVFRVWQKARQETLHCHGIPGAGKTFLTSTVIGYLHKEYGADSTVHIAYVYSNFRQRGQQGNQKLDDLLASLVKQLAQYNQSIPQVIVDLFGEHNRRRTRPSLEDLIGALQIVIAISSKPFIVIDALDELSDECRTRLLRAIFKIQANTDLNVFVTSRPNLDVEKEFQRCVSYKALDIRASDEDVTKYLEGRFSELKVTVSDILGEQIKKAIIEAADGMFLLAQLYFGLLLGRTSIAKIKETLIGLRPRQKGDSTESSRAEALAHAYAQTMERINEQHSGLQELAKETLCWLSSAQRQITSRELQCGLAISTQKLEFDKEDIPEIGTIVSVCHGLVAMDKESEIIRLVHQTAQEYLENNQDVLHGSMISDTGTYLAEKCIAYLSSSSFQSGPCQDVQSCEARLQQNPFLDYAVQHWGDHMKQASPELSCTVPKFLENEHSLASIVQATAVSKNIWPDRRSLKLTTAFHLTANLGLTDTMMALLKKGFPFDSPDQYKQTPLLLTSSAGHKAAAQLLVEKGALVDTITSTFNQSPLFQASLNGHETITQLLIKNGAQIDRADWIGDTALSAASKRGHEAVVRILVENGAKINHENRESWTPLLLASRHGHAHVVRLLIEKGAKVNTFHGNGWTPLLLASRYENDRIARFLTRTHRAIDEMDRFGQTPLLQASAHGHEDVARLLIENGAMVNLVHWSDWTPLLLASEYGHEAVARLLIEKGASINVTRKDGSTPLMLASKRGCEPIARLLIQNGAAINLRSKYGYTALMLASKVGNMAVVRLLTEHGAETEGNDIRVPGLLISGFDDDFMAHRPSERHTTVSPTDEMD